MLSFLRVAVLLSAFFCLVSLTILVAKTFSFGRKHIYAEPRQGGVRGILYAFGRGMMPWEKESAAMHLPTYIAGILYHAGIFAALFYLLALVFSLESSKTFVSVLRLLFLLAFLSGLNLLGKRIIFPTMRKISCPDDFFANMAVDIFLLLALVQTYTSSAKPFFFLLAIVMFLYIPLGKIRHCFFFFYAKILYGLFYGRRGILPPKTKQI